MEPESKEPETIKLTKQTMTPGRMSQTSLLTVKAQQRLKSASWLTIDLDLVAS